MNKEDIKNILLDNKNVSDIVFLKDIPDLKNVYSFSISCSVIIDESIVPIYIGVSENWSQKLFDIYIKDYEQFPFIPHVEEMGKLCLYDLEGILVDTDFEGLLNTCIDRAIKIIYEGINRINEEDFVKEFSSYWNKIKGGRFAKIVIPMNKKTSKISYVEDVINRRKNENYVTYLNRKKLSKIFISSNRTDFDLWNKKGTNKYASYILVKSDVLIMPPDFRKKLDASYFNRIFEKLDVESTKNIIDFNGKIKLFIFHVIQPNGIENIFSAIFENVEMDVINSKCKIKNNPIITPLYLERVDKPALVCRTNEISQHVSKRVLLIGCGSIGSYFANELVKAGFENITLVDKDLLCAENIYRHFLGIEYVDKYKAEALKNYFDKNIPNLSIVSKVQCIYELVQDEAIDFSDYDLVVSAVGDPNLNRFLNQFIRQKSINVPVIYLWNEPLDIGCHLALIKPEYKGCYDCFFKYDNNDELYDSTAFTQKGQKVTRNFSGCGGSFIPYGSTTSLKSATLGMDYVVKLFDGTIKENILVSIKGDGIYFKKAGFDTSNVYKEQTERERVVYGTNFLNGKCTICKGKA